MSKVTEEAHGSEAKGEPTGFRRFFDPRRDKPGEVIGGLLALGFIFVIFGFAFPIFATMHWREDKSDAAHQWVLVAGWLAGAAWVVVTWLIVHYGWFSSGPSDGW